MSPTPQGAPDPAASSGAASWALAAGLIIVCIWGANFAVQKALFQVLPPAGFLFARYLLMPLCAALLLVFSRQVRRDVPRKDMIQMALLGLLGHSVHVTMVTFGIHWSTAFSSALILACGPIFTLLILHWVGHERLSWPQIAGVGIACVGVLVFLSDKLLGQQWAATGGDLMMLLAAALFSYYTVMSKPLIQRHGGVTVMAYATIAGSPPVVLFCASTAWAAPWATMGGLHWALLLWASLVSAFLGWLVWGWVNERRGVARTAPLQYLMPVVAGVVAWWATGERFSPVKLGGAALTLGGVALAQFADRLRQRG
jgi:drug/metabolite transporter (DMT)-like permease